MSWFPGPNPGLARAGPDILGPIPFAKRGFKPKLGEKNLGPHRGKIFPGVLTGNLGGYLGARGKEPPAGVNSFGGRKIFPWAGNSGNFGGRALVPPWCHRRAANKGTRLGAQGHPGGAP